MTMYSGRLGYVTVGTPAKKCVTLTEWNLDVNADTETLEYFGNNGWKAAMSNMVDWSATARGFWDMDDATDTGQQDMQNNLLGLTAGMVPTDVAVQFWVEDNGATHKHYDSTAAVIKSLNVKCNANGIVEVEFSFEGNGAIDYSTT